MKVLFHIPEKIFMKTGKIFVDTNIWIYSFVKTDNVKHLIAKELIEYNIKRIIINSQIINELCYNLIRKSLFTEDQIQKLTSSMFSLFTINNYQLNHYLSASNLRDKYKFSFWDSLIVASALEANCSILYSEDMHNGTVINNTLKIINPFN